MSSKHVSPLFGQGSFVVEEFWNRSSVMANLRNGHNAAERFLDALDDLIIEDIPSMTGDELRAEIVAEGGDPDAIEAECRAALERAIREAEASRAGGRT